MAKAIISRTCAMGNWGRIGGSQNLRSYEKGVASGDERGMYDFSRQYHSESGKNKY